MRILILENDNTAGENLSKVLNLDGYAVDWVLDKGSAMLALETHKYEMLLLSVESINSGKFSLLMDIRAKYNDILIIILTASDDIHYKIQGLDSGADDYLSKPFKLEELKARIRALRRRREGYYSPLLKTGLLELNPALKQLAYDSKPVKLNAKEFAIIFMLMERPQKIFSKEELENNLYGWNKEIESNVIEVHISNLRKKLGRKTIETIKNMGYRITKF